MGFSERRTENKTAGSASGMSAGGLTAFIDQGSEFTGKLTFRDTVRIDGSFQGEISSENTLIVGETGSIEANIRSQVVVVSGTVNGDIFALRQVVLHKTAQVKGSIDTGSLVIEDGAEFEGAVKMGKSAGKKDKGAKSDSPTQSPTDNADNADNGDPSKD